MALFDKYRYVVLAVGFFGLFSICANYILVNFNFICMIEDKNDVIILGNGTLRQRYDYTPQEKSYIHWGVGIGSIIGTFPINWAYVRWGAKFPFFIAGVLSAVATALTPIAAHWGIGAFIFVRLLQGLAFAADFAAMGMLTVRWAPLSETGIFLGFLTSFTPVANTIANAGSGIMCSTVGWRAAFYFHAAFTLFIFVVWLLIYSDDPQTNGGVSPRELELIQRNKTPEHIERDSFVPYKAICSNWTIIVVWLNAFTELVALVSMLTYAPIYMRKILGLEIGSVALWTSLSSALHLPIKLVMAFLSDWITRYSETAKMMFFNTLAVGLVGVCTGLIPLAPAPWMSVALYVFCHWLASANSSGFYKCAALHARQYAHVVLATIQFMKCMALFVGPAMFWIFLDSDEDRAGWTIVFAINGIAMIAANCLFYFTASDEAAAFTSITRKSDGSLVDKSDEKLRTTQL